jgi:hypothetical protein
MSTTLLTSVWGVLAGLCQLGAVGLPHYAPIFSSLSAGFTGMLGYHAAGK